jgi:undecaprenyl-diphosphatase
MTIIYITLFTLCFILSGLLWLGLIPNTINRLQNFISKNKNHSLSNNTLLYLLSLSFITVFLHLIFLSQAIITSEAVSLLDQNLNNLILTTRHTWLTKLFLFITDFGLWQMAIVAGIGLSAYCWMHRQKIFISAYAITVTGAGLASLFGKQLLQRTRPSFPVYQELNFSFPSGHATMAIAIYGFLLYFYLRQAQHKTHQSLIVIFFTSLIISIGFSRLYLGVHYLTDVIGGYLLGLLWLIIGISIVEQHIAPPKR